MEQNNELKYKISEFLKKNGYRLLILAIVAIVITKKDLDFRFNLKSPTRSQPSVEQPMPKKSIPNSKQSRISENEDSEKDKTKDTEPEQKSGLLPGTSSNEYIDVTKIGLYLKQKMDKAGKSSIESYIKRFSKVAVSEQAKYGVPVSITLGQALLNSAAGSTALSQQGNNHFGMVCGDWSGNTRVYPDGNCYRHYKNAWRSFRDHSQFITTGKFAPLTTLADNDYERWAIQLEAINFDTDNDYAETLVEIIEKYQLQDLDE